MIKALIFDFYGVIYSNLDWEVIDQRIKTDEQKAVEFKKLVQKANVGSVDNTKLLEGISKLADDAMYPENLAVNFEPSINYSALGLIENLKIKYKTGLLSNGGRANIDEVLNDVGGAGKYFNVVMSSSDTSYIKPAKEAFLNMSELLGSEPNETLVIDDSYRHIQGADTAGLKTIRFVDMEQLRSELNRFGIF